MKTLCLMRHAEAEKGPDDHARPLTLRGQEQARAAALWLQGKGVVSDSIIASDALRTRQTAEIFSAKIELTRTLYLAEAEIILNAAENALVTCDTVMIVAHNPGMYEAALRLSGVRGEDILGMPPATIVVYKDGIHDSVFIAD